MSFPGPNQPPSNGGGNKPNGGNNPFTNPFSRNNDGKNGGNGANGNKSNGPRPFWQSPWLWVVVVALLAVTMFQLFAGAGSQTIDTKDGMQILNGNTVEYATIVDNTQQVKLKLSSDYSATDPDTGRTKNTARTCSSTTRTRSPRPWSRPCRRPIRPRAGPRPCSRPAFGPTCSPHCCRS